MPIISSMLNRLGYSQKVTPDASRCGIIEARFITSFLEANFCKNLQGAYPGCVHHCLHTRTGQILFDATEGYFNFFRKSVGDWPVSSRKTRLKCVND